VGFDRVVEDDTAKWANGQEAYHVIASVLYRDPMHRNLGFFYTYRTQREPGDAPRPTNVHAIDLYGELDQLSIGAGWQLRVGAEGALIVGETERVLTYTNPDNTEVLSGGAALELDVHAPDRLATIHFRTGYTSASGDPDRGVLQDFTFDRNYNVGLILFDELQGNLEAATHALLEDESNTGSPPDGSELLVSEGSVRRAVYLWPSVTIRPTQWLDVQAGVMSAFSTGPIAQSYYTFRAGGTPHNHLDEPTSGRYLGTEIDFGLGIGRGPRTADWWFRPSLWLQGGVAFPSEDMGGGTLGLFMARAQVDF
jgi:hypothetical protein